MKKRIFCLLLTLLAVFSAGCGKPEDGKVTDSVTGQVGGNAPAEKVYTVGICQFTQHDALDAATDGFIETLTKEMTDRVKFRLKNASGDPSGCASILSGFVSSKVDLILANATPALQAAAGATDSIPILGTAVTEYGVALDIENFSGTVGGNISGTSDLAPLDRQALMIGEVFPDAKNIALLYCSAEPNSLYQINEMKGYLGAMGCTCKEFTFTDTSDVSAVTEAACGFADVIYIPTDNTAASCGEAIANVVLDKKIPVAAGEEGICAACGTVTLTINYYELGAATAKMAARILRGEENIAEMPIEYAPAVKKYNPRICEALGVTVPDGYTEIEQ